MPLTFEALKGQRFRRCFGGVQLLRRHWRSLLPWDRDRDNRLSGSQRMAYLSGGLQWTGDLLGLGQLLFLFVAAGNIALGGVLIVRRLSPLLLVAVPTLVILGIVRAVGGIHRAAGGTWREAIGALGIWLALSVTVARACLRGAVEPAGVFLRTPKNAEPHFVARVDENEPARDHARHMRAGRGFPRGSPPPATQRRADRRAAGRLGGGLPGRTAEQSRRAACRPPRTITPPPRDRDRPRVDPPGRLDAQPAHWVGDAHTRCSRRNGCSACAHAGLRLDPHTGTTPAARPGRRGATDRNPRATTSSTHAASPIAKTNRPATTGDSTPVNLPSNATPSGNATTAGPPGPHPLTSSDAAHSTVGGPTATPSGTSAPSTSGRTVPAPPTTPTRTITNPPAATSATNRPTTTPSPSHSHTAS
jgi:hypothetical protein